MEIARLGDHPHVAGVALAEVFGKARRQGACVVAVFQRDIAESKATEATDIAKSAGFPLLFTTEPEE